MSSTQILNKISDQANKMEDEQKVDLSVVNTLNELQDSTKQTQSKWVEKKTENSFYFYNASKSVELIIEKMIDRFKKSHENHDNPQVALDTLTLVPNLIEIIQITEEDKSDDETTEKIIEQTYKLRNKAAEKRLLESEERNMQEINEGRLLDTLSGIVGQLNIPKEPLDVVDANDDEDIS